MVACVSPADYNYEETLSTLRYAARAKNITNKPKINEDPKDAMMREYQAEINMLKKLLEQSGTTGNGTTLALDVNANVDIHEQIKQEKLKIEREFEEKAQQLRLEHDQHKREKEEMIHSKEI
jgi:hypothetical protein